MDKNYDGVFEIKYNEYIEITQKQDEELISCYQDDVSGVLDNLFTDISEVLATNESGLISTSFGYDVDPACLKKWGNTFLNDVKDSMKTGLQCLSKLHKDSGLQNVTGALENSFLISKLLKNERVSLVCAEETGYKWTGTAAHASTSNSVNAKLKDYPNIKHPFISINPTYPNVDSDRTLDQERDYIKSTIFHEQLHNIGYKHGDSIEYPYACSDCCFGKDPEKKALGCKICLGNYDDGLDEKYIEDLIPWAQKTFKNGIAEDVSIKYLKENNKSIFGVTMLAKSFNLGFSPVGEELKNQIIKGNPDLSEEELESLNTIYGYYSGNIKYISESKVVANALYELYYNKNSKNSLSYIEKNKKALRKLVKKSKKKNHSLASKDLVSGLDKIIYEIWINNYPDQSESTNAYELYKYLGLDK